MTSFRWTSFSFQLCADRTSNEEVTAEVVAFDWAMEERARGSNSVVGVTLVEYASASQLAN
jgi:hypothetical protein